MLEDCTQIAQIDHLCFSRDIGFKEGSVEIILREHPEVIFCVAEHEDRIAGYIFVIPQDGSNERLRLHPGESGVAQMASVAVAPDARRMGIAGRLIERAAREAETRFTGCSRIILETSASNVLAQSVYRKAGFRPVEQLPAYYPDQTDAIRFEKSLGLPRSHTPILGPSFP